MPFQSKAVVLDAEQRAELEEISSSQSLPAGFVLRAKIVLLLADGWSYPSVVDKLDTSMSTVGKWKRRFLEAGVDGLETERPGQAPSKLTPRLRARILDATRRKPRYGSTHWSCRKLAAQLGVSKTIVHRVWQEAGLKPHRLERYMASNDPDFERKAADIIGLYLDPPQHAAVFCVDEKTAIQALDRRDRVLPLSPGRAERHGFEYKRNGTLSLYAALNTKTGKVQGKTADRHTSKEFVGFLEEVVAPYEAEQEIHIICDNLSAHKTKRVAEFLQAHGNVQLHFTPTYSSWLNQVELWFSKLQRDVIARGIFTSTTDLARQLRRYINAYSKAAKPIHWKYSNPSRRILHVAPSSGTVHYYYNFVAHGTRRDSLVRPFITGGVGMSSFGYPGYSAFSRGETKFGYNYGAGIKFKLTDKYGLRFDVRDHITSKPFFRDSSGRLHNIETSATFSFLF